MTFRRVAVVLAAIGLLAAGFVSGFVARERLRTNPVIFLHPSTYPASDSYCVQVETLNRPLFGVQADQQLYIVVDSSVPTLTASVWLCAPNVPADHLPEVYEMRTIVDAKALGQHASEINGLSHR